MEGLKGYHHKDFDRASLSIFEPGMKGFQNRCQRSSMLLFHGFPSLGCDVNDMTTFCDIISSSFPCVTHRKHGRHKRVKRKNPYHGPKEILIVHFYVLCYAIYKSFSSQKILIESDIRSSGQWRMQAASTTAATTSWS
jgi:hypothetical protein